MNNAFSLHKFERMYTLCERKNKHQDSRIALTSPRIRDGMPSGLPIDLNDLWKLKINAFESRFIYVDKKFMEECGLLGIKEIHFDPYNEGHAKLYQSLVRVCAECLNEYLLKNGVLHSE